MNTCRRIQVEPFQVNTCELPAKDEYRKCLALSKSGIQQPDQHTLFVNNRITRNQIVNSLGREIRKRNEWHRFKILWNLSIETCESQENCNSGQLCELSCACCEFGKRKFHDNICILPIESTRSGIWCIACNFPMILFINFTSLSSYRFDTYIFSVAFVAQQLCKCFRFVGRIVFM